MITKLRLVNFQSHKDTTVEFSSVTGIYAENDVGKSSILRGLYWLCFNKPDGIEFRSHWAEKQEVLVEGWTDDGFKVVRKRSHQIYSNVYEIWKGDDKLHEFRSFGRGKVPDEVQSVLRIKPTSFQLQHNKIYLLDCSPLEIARQLNEIVGLDVMDDAIKNIASVQRRLVLEQNRTQKEYDDLEQKEQRFCWIADASVCIQRANNEQDRIDKAQKHIQELISLQKEHQENSVFLQMSQHIEVVIPKIDKACVFQEQVVEKKELLSSLFALQKAYWLTKQKLKQKPKIRLQRFKQVEKKRKSIIARQKEIKKLNSVFSSYVDTKKKIKENRKALRNNRRKLKKVMPNICPLCGAKT